MLALEGDRELIKLIFDRIDGKVKPELDSENESQEFHFHFNGLEPKNTVKSEDEKPVGNAK